MYTTPDIEKMTKAEKISAMESLWNDLCQDKISIVSPAWHGEILRDRKRRVKAGTEIVVDWADAKEMLRKAARKRPLQGRRGEK